MYLVVSEHYSSIRMKFSIPVSGTSIKRSSPRVASEAYAAGARIKEVCII